MPAFILEEDNVSYTWRNKNTKTSSPGRTILSCDNSIIIEDEEENHEGGMNILRLDGAVNWTSTGELSKNKYFEEGGLEEYFAAKRLGI